MVPSLHQGNIYTKRNLRVWTDQKCIALIGAKTPRTCAGHQTTTFQGSRYRAENGNKQKFGWTYRHGTVFAPRQYLYQKEATGMERLEMYSLSHFKNPSHLCGPSNYPISGSRYWAENRNLRILGWTYRHGNIYMKKKLREWRDKKSILLVGAKTSLTRAIHQTSRSQGSWYRAENGNLWKLGSTYCHGTEFAPR